MPRAFFGRLTLGFKLGIIVASCVALVIALATELFVRQAQTLADDQARRLAAETVGVTAERVSQRLAAEFRKVFVAASGLSALRGAAIHDPAASAAIVSHLMAGSTALRAAWLIWAPDLGAATGHRLLRWERTGASFSADPASNQLSPSLLGEPLFRSPLVDGQAFVSEPYYLVDGDGDHLAVISYAEPVLVGGKVVGAVGIDVAIEPLQASICAIERPTSAMLTLASTDGTVVATSRASLASMSLHEKQTGLNTDFALARLRGRYDANRLEGGRPVVRGIRPITFSSAKSPWYVVMDVPLAAFTAQVTMARMPMLAPAVVVLLCLLGLILIAMRIIVTRPLRGIETYIRRLRDDPAPAMALDLTRSDEIGSIARALVNFRQSESEIDRLKASQTEVDLHHAEARRRELKQLADELAHSVQVVAGVVTRSSDAIMHRAEGMSAIAVESTQKAKVIADAAAAAGTSVNAVDAAAGFLQRSIDQITSEAMDARAIASAAAKQARSSTIVTSELSIQASRIGVVVDTISKIAQQTNLLALNATIEAARSGEAGRAFAIVAQEVKALATQTGIATGEIAQQIDAMRTTAGNAAAVLASIGTTIERIDQMAAAISGAVAVQGEATGSIAGYVCSAVAATRHVDRAIEDVDRCTGETGRAAAAMLEEIATLTDVSKQLGEQVSDAIARIRMAQAA